MPESLFRSEALEAYSTGRTDTGDLLRLSPRWAAGVYWLLAAAALGGASFAIFGRIPDYATGPAVAVASTGGADALELVALLPARYRDALAPGTPVRVRLPGAARLQEGLSIERVGPGLVGPGEVRRMLGSDTVATLAVNRPVVLVHIRVPNQLALEPGRAIALREGAQVTAEVRTGTKRILFGVLPWMRALAKEAP